MVPLVYTQLPQNIECNRQSNYEKPSMDKAPNSVNQNNKHNDNTLAIIMITTATTIMIKALNNSDSNNPIIIMLIPAVSVTPRPKPSFGRLKS